MVNMEAVPPRTDLDDYFVAMIAGGAPKLVAHFFDALLHNRESRVYLDSNVVDNELKPALIAWLGEVLSADLDDAAFESRQQYIGRLHARINIPVHLIGEGASLLQTAIAESIRHCDQPWESRYDAMCAVYTRIDRAIAIIARSYVHGVEDRAHLEEAYRLFALDQDLSLEHERQRSSLMEWSQTTLFDMLQTDGSAQLQPLSGTSFGLWVRHRAGVMFEHSAQLAVIGAAITRVDTQLLPALAATDPAPREEALQGMRSSVEQISALLTDLFQSTAAMESGRDTLTRTMNRRFLPSILAREVSFAMKNSLDLAAMMFDIDNFKELNDTYGHQAGDAVLRQVAEVVADNLRATDFFFRYGGEEFLILLVEAGPRESARAAERVRRAVSDRTFVADNTELSVTISIGLAAYDGHRDPDHLIYRADKALYRAKAGGRNRVAISA